MEKKVITDIIMAISKGMSTAAILANYSYNIDTIEEIRGLYKKCMNKNDYPGVIEQIDKILNQPKEKIGAIKIANKAMVDGKTGQLIIK